MQPIDDRQRLDLILRNRLHPFTQRVFETVCPGQQFLANWHIAAITWELEKVARGQTKRLLITVPPRYLKSICASVALPCWILGRQPDRRLICLSHSEELAGKHARDSRTVMNSPWYKQLFPGTRIGREKNRELDFVTTRQGYRFATSVGGPLTGRGGNYVVIDDVHKANEVCSQAKRNNVKEWYGTTVSSRLDNKNTDAIIVVMQRVHADDLVAMLLSSQEHWEHLRLPAIAEERQRVQIGPNRHHVRELNEPLHAERESLEVLEQQRQVMGNANFSAQYQQRPIALGGGLLEWGWFKYYDELPEMTPDMTIVQSWDTAFKAGQLHDFSVCMTWLASDNGYYLLDTFRDRLRFPELQHALIEQANKYAAQVILIEDRGSGTSLAQSVDESRLHEGFECIDEVQVREDKVTRMSAQSGKIEAGRVFLPQQASWMDTFRDEVLAFPNGAHDDQIDSMSQFLAWAEDSYETVTGIIGYI